MNSPNAGFLLAVDLETFRVWGSPRPRCAEGLFAAISGHLAHEVMGTDRLGRLRSAYRRHGERLSAHLLGQYAAAVVDPSARRIVLAQDSLGIRPLFFAMSGTRLVASADLAALVTLLRPSTLDEAYFADYLTRGDRTRRRTPFAGIERLARGVTVTIEPSRRSELRPWSPPLRQERPPAGEAEERLRTLLDDAVASSLPADGEVLCELSGGLDSTSVLATAHRLRPGVQALTVVSRQGFAGDDEPHAREAVNALGVRWHQLDFDRCPPYSAFQASFVGEPGGVLLEALQAAYSEILARTGAHVIMTGMAGDLIFGSGGIPPFHIADPLAAGRLLDTIRMARSWRACTVDQRPWTYWFAHFGARPAWRHLRRQSIDARSDGPPAWLGPTLAGDGAAREHPGRETAPRVSLPSQQYLWDEVYDQAFAQSPGFRLPTSADARHPLFHRPLVEYMLSVPPDFRHGPTGDRVLQRRALADRLPVSIRTRSTKGSAQRLREHTLMHNDAWFRLLTEDSRLVARGWVDPERWRTTVARARFGAVKAAPQFDAAMATECWLRTIEAYPADVPVQLLEASAP